MEVRVHRNEVETCCSKVGITIAVPCVSTFPASVPVQDAAVLEAKDLRRQRGHRPNRERPVNHVTLAHVNAELALERAVGARVRPARVVRPNRVDEHAIAATDRHAAVVGRIPHLAARTRGTTLKGEADKASMQSLRASHRASAPPCRPIPRRRFASSAAPSLLARSRRWSGPSIRATRRASSARSATRPIRPTRASSAATPTNQATTCWSRRRGRKSSHGRPSRGGASTCIVHGPHQRPGEKSAGFPTSPVWLRERRGGAGLQGPRRRGDAVLPDLGLRAPRSQRGTPEARTSRPAARSSNGSRRCQPTSACRLPTENGIGVWKVVTTSQ